MSGPALGLGRYVWCAYFINKIEHALGRPGIRGGWAKDFERYGRRVREPVIGAIAPMNRDGGGHVGIVSGVDGDPILSAATASARS